MKFINPNKIEETSLFGNMEKVRYLRNPKDFTGNLHTFASFLSPFIIHPVLKTIYESGGNLPLRCPVKQEKMEVKNIRHAARTCSTSCISGVANLKQ